MICHIGWGRKVGVFVCVCVCCLVCHFVVNCLWQLHVIDVVVIVVVILCCCCNESTFIIGPRYTHTGGIAVSFGAVAIICCMCALWLLLLLLLLLIFPFVVVYFTVVRLSVFALAVS